MAKTAPAPCRRGAGLEHFQLRARNPTVVDRPPPPAETTNGADGARTRTNDGTIDERDHDIDHNRITSDPSEDGRAMSEPDRQRHEQSSTSNPDVNHSGSVEADQSHQGSLSEPPRGSGDLDNGAPRQAWRKALDERCTYWEQMADTLTAKDDLSPREAAAIYDECHLEYLEFPARHHLTTFQMPAVDERWNRALTHLKISLSRSRNRYHLRGRKMLPKMISSIVEGIIAGIGRLFGK